MIMTEDNDDVCSAFDYDTDIYFSDFDTESAESLGDTCTAESDITLTADEHFSTDETLTAEDTLTADETLSAEEFDLRNQSQHAKPLSYPANIPVDKIF